MHRCSRRAQSSSVARESGTRRRKRLTNSDGAGYERRPPMLDPIFAWYREPLFLLFPLATVLISSAAFIVFAVPLTWIASRDPDWARSYRIQSRPPRAQQLVGPSVKS